MPKNRKRCFVIMPFSETSEEHSEEYWTDHFESFLKPLIEECPNLEAYRSEPLRGDVLRQIITELVVAPVVVADLTDWNPNVFWELGVRQSFKHGSVTIAEEGTEIPFDVSGKATLFYHPKDHIKNAKFVKKFKKAITHCLSHPEKPDSHVLETVSGRGTLFEIIHRDEAARRVEALIYECTYNIINLEVLYDLIKKNQKNPKGRKWVTHPFQTSSLELLTTTRYLDEEDPFYESAMILLVNFLSRNEQLRNWQDAPEETEEWFLKTPVRKIKGDLKKLEKKLHRIRKQLTALS